MKETATMFLASQIEQYNEKLLEMDMPQMPLGLFQGKMGLCLYFALQYKCSANKEFEKKATILLEEIYKNIGSYPEQLLQRELPEIAIGFLNLLETGIFGGNPNNVLKDIDDRLFRDISLIRNNPNIDNNSFSKIIWGTIYFCYRCSNQKISANNRKLFQRLIIESLNKIEKILPNVINSGPLFFSPFNYSLLLFLRMLVSIYALHIYDYKIERICKDLLDRLIATFPTSIGHRFLLSHMLQQVACIVSDKNVALKFTTHADMLYENSDMNNFFDEELGSRCIFLGNGVAGLWHFMNFSHIVADEAVKKKMTEKIELSDIWKKNELTKEYFDSEKSINGLPGVILAYQQIKNNK